MNLDTEECFLCHRRRQLTAFLLEASFLQKTLVPASRAHLFSDMQMSFMYFRKRKCIWHWGYRRTCSHKV